MGTDGNDYWTDCTPSTSTLPHIPDLIPTNRIQVWRELQSTSQQLRLDVRNVGNATVKSGPVRILLDGVSVQARLSAGAAGLKPGDTAEIYFESSSSTFRRGREYTVQIDIDHQLQEAPFDTYSNDMGRAKTSCLSWTTPIDEFAWGTRPNALIAGKTIEAIVNGQTTGRADGALCTSCHTGADIPGKNRVPAGGYISPTRVIGGSTWASYPGIIQWFENARPNGSPKPQHLIDMFLMWRRDGTLNEWSSP